MEKNADTEMNKALNIGGASNPAYDKENDKKSKIAFGKTSSDQKAVEILELDKISENDDVFQEQKRQKRSIRQIFSTRKSNKSEKENGDVLKNMFADALLSPTKPSHLGIFRYMAFEHQSTKDSNSILSGTTDHSDHAPFTQKEKMRHILHSKAIHLIIIILVLFDSVLVVIELLFDLRIIGPPNGEHVIREIFHGFSIGILTMFMIELVLKVWADRHHFIRHKIEVLDGFVVSVSWVIDIVLVFINSVALLVTELLLLLRLWRIFRIVNGIIVAVKTKADERIHYYKEQNTTMMKKLMEAEVRIKLLEKNMDRLQAILDENGIKVHENRI